MRLNYIYISLNYLIIMKEDGAIRIGRNLKAYIYKNNSWKETNFSIPIDIIKLYKSNNNFKILVDKKNPKFLKGQIFKDKIQGARINILPNGKVLDKAFSLFAKHLTIHDESSHSHWDVIYENPCGKYAYCYTLEKKKKSSINKYHKVEEFEKHYDEILKKSFEDIKSDYSLALPMYTLLKTCMRIGNEIYYKTHKHKGLVTLKKSDVKIDKNKVTFDYLGKDGVPLTLTEIFPQTYIIKLKELLKNKKEKDYLFTDENNKPLEDRHFKHAFKKYCGIEFYPHIVRSYYATERAKEFLESHKESSKEEIKELFLSIAEKLGHKRYDKKEKEWKDSFNVTIHHYIQPKLVEEIQSLVK